MEKSKQRWKRLLAWIIAVTVTVGSVPVLQGLQVSAAGENNLALEATATASDQETGDFPAGKANDGIIDRSKPKNQSRWASSTDAVPHWLALEFAEPVVVKTVVIEWERRNATDYKLQVSEDGEKWDDIQSFGQAPAEYRQEISLGASRTVKYVRVWIDRYLSNAEEIDWNTVSIYEMEVYSGGAPAPSQSLESVISSLNAPDITEDTGVLPLPQVPAGFQVDLLGADYEQVIGADGTIYRPLTDKTVTLNYTVSDGTDTMTSANLKIAVPGVYEETGEGNEKPAVIPELAEWYGTTGEFITGQDAAVLIDPAYEGELKEAAEAFAADYQELTGRVIGVRASSEKLPGDFYFTMDQADSGLGDEGYYMSVEDSVSVQAGGKQGAYWATRTILQILKQTGNTIPKGITRDYPKYKVRGFMLDVGRKPFELETLREIVKNMAWYKMNDFQVHLSDNAFLEYYIDPDNPDINDAYQAYSGFRLESSIKNDQGVGLTSRDVSYSKKEFQNFIQESRALGVNIVPEIDVPAHSLAITKVFPEFALNEMKTGGARPKPLVDHIDIRKPGATELVKSIFDDYITGEDPAFDMDTTVHIGTDEFESDTDAYRRFTDQMLEHIQDSGRKVRMWGSLTQMSGSAPVRSENVQMNLWNTWWASPEKMLEEGYHLINTVDTDLYIVPNVTTYYRDHLDVSYIYNTWDVTKMDSYTAVAGTPQLDGAAYALWNDNTGMLADGVCEYDALYRIFQPLTAFAEKTWGEAGDKTLEELESLTRVIGTAPGSNPFSELKSSRPTLAEYSFTKDSIRDYSGNQNDGITKENISYTDGKDGRALQLKGGGSYVETPLDRIGSDYRISFWVKKDPAGDQGEQILFESDTKHGAYEVKAVQKETGKVGFSREGYDYSFDYTLAEGEWVYLTFEGIRDVTRLYVNQELVSTLGETGKKATLTFPLQRIGSSEHAFNGSIDEILVESAEQSAGAAIPSEKFVITCDNENGPAKEGKEGPAALAFDGKADTHWHSNYSPVTPLPAAITIDLGRSYALDKLEYTPRQDGNANG